MDENCPDDEEEAREKLKSLQRTWKLKMWHDHSDILNHSYVMFMLSIMYNPANFLTDEEYVKGSTSPAPIQSLVEKPQLYLLGQSPSTDTDQVLYTSMRLEDLEALDHPIVKCNGVDITATLRVFSGDGPARQFESGQQRGGNYSCVCGAHVDMHQNLEFCWRLPTLSLEDRRKLFTAGL